MYLTLKDISLNLKKLKEGRKIRNKTESSLEDRICTLLQMYHIKREAWFSGAKLNGVKCRRLMDQNELIINDMLQHIHLHTLN